MSSLPRWKAGVWGIAATLQSTKNRHTRAPLPPPHISLRPLLPNPPSTLPPVSCLRWQFLICLCSHLRPIPLQPSTTSATTTTIIITCVTRARTHTREGGFLVRLNAPPTPAHGHVYRHVYIHMHNRAGIHNESASVTHRV